MRYKVVQIYNGSVGTYETTLRTGLSQKTAVRLAKRRFASDGDGWSWTYEVRENRDCCCENPRPDRVIAMFDGRAAA